MAVWRGPTRGRNPRIVATVVLAAIVLALARAAESRQNACKGREVKAVSVEQCVEDSVLSVVNVTAQIVPHGAKCLLYVRGCVAVSREVRSAVVAVTLRRGYITYYNKKNFDACKAGMGVPIFGALITGSDGSCYRPPGVVCSGDDAAPADVSRFAAALAFARGKWTAEVHVRHGRAGASCLRATLLLA